MQIMKGIVKDDGYKPTEVTYAKIDENTIYYFMEDGDLPNRNIIATTVLKEAIEHAPATSLGLINEKGQVLIPFEHKSMKKIKDNLILAERNVPKSQNVVDAMNNKTNQQYVTALEQNAQYIKQQLTNAMGMSGDFIFDNPYSEAAIYTMDGLNVGGDYFSFISEMNSNYYFSTNIKNSSIIKFNPEMLTSLNNEQQQNEIPPQTTPMQNEIAQENQQTVELQQDNNPSSFNIDIPIQQEALDQQPVSEVPPTVAADDMENPQVINQANQENEDAMISTETMPEVTPENDQMEEDAEEISEDQEIGETVMDGEEDQLESSEEIDENDELETSEEVNDEITDDEEIEEEDEMTDEVSNVDDSLESSEEIDEEDDVEDSKESENEIIDEEIDKTDSQNEKIIQFPGQYKLTDEDIATPVIKDATQTIRNIVEENRKLRQTIDKRDGKIIILESNLEILNEDNRAKDEDNQLLRQELTLERQEKASFKTQMSNFKRENIKLRGALERQANIVAELERQNKELREQVAGIKSLNNAVTEANALVRPLESDATQYENDNIVYGDFNYLGNGNTRGKVA